MKVQINRDLLPMKGHYFLFSAGVAPVQPFMPVIARDLNFPSHAVGIINGVLPFTGMLAKPFFGAVADRFRLHKFVFISFQILTMIGFFNVQFVSKIEKNDSDKVKLVCGAETNFDICFKDPNKFTDCLIRDVLEDANLNKTVKCSLRCDLSPELRTELCGPWRANPKICTEDISSKARGTVYSHYPEDESILLGQHRNHSLSAPLDDVKLEFLASVPMKHTLKVADCLYFRVADAQLNDESRHIPYCEHETDTHCKIYCEDSTLSDLLKTMENQNSSKNAFAHHPQFWVFLLLSCISWVGMAVVGSVADAVCFEILGDKTSNYGYQRLWGSVGWGLSAIVAGLIVDKVSVGDKANFTPVFYIMCVFIACDITCSYTLKYEQTKISSNLFRNVGKLLADVWIDIFLIWCIVLGMCVGVQWTFLFWHLEKLTECDQRSSQKTLLGLVSGVQCFLGEMPSFFAFSWLVKKIGHINIMTLIPLIMGIRFMLYSILPNPWWTLPVELLQASLGLGFATMASYASIVAPHGAEATVQGLVGAIFEGIGVSLGSYLGGIIFETYGGKGLFQIFGVLAFALCLSHGMAHLFLGKKIHTDGKDFGGVAKYATPNEAVSMLEDT